MPTNLFGLYLRRARAKHALSLDDLAGQLGVSSTYLGEVERGVRPVLPKRYWTKLQGALRHIDPLALDIFWEVCHTQTKLPRAIDTSKLRSKYVLSTVPRGKTK